MSNVLRWKAEKEAALTTALARLGAARRERLTAEDLKVYADGLRGYPLEAITAVCDDFARKPVEDYGPRFPTLGSLVAGVKDYLKRDQIRREQSTLKLPEARPVDPPKLEDFKARVEAYAQTRKMS
jgi:hypothetical protein